MVLEEQKDTSHTFFSGICCSSSMDVRWHLTIFWAVLKKTWTTFLCATAAAERPPSPIHKIT